MRAEARPARHRDDRARARHSRGRRQRPQRRVPDLRAGGLLQRRPRALRRRAGAPPLRVHARGPGGDLRPGRGARGRRRGTAHRAPARLRFGGGGRARAPPRRGAERRRLSGRAGRPRRAAAGAAACLPQRLPHRPRRRAPAGALDPGPGGSGGAGRRAHPRGRRGRRSRVAARRAHGTRHRPRATRGGRGGRRAAASGAGHRRPRAGAAAAHGRDGGAAGAARRVSRLRALGLRVLPADPRRPAAGGRVLRPRRRLLLHRPRRGRSPGLGPHRALPRRSARSGGADHAPVGRDGRLQRRRAARGGRGRRGCTSPAGTRATATCSATSRAGRWPTGLPASPSCCPGSAGGCRRSAAGRRSR